MSEREDLILSTATAVRETHPDFDMCVTIRIAPRESLLRQAFALAPNEARSLLVQLTEAVASVDRDLDRLYGSGGER